MPTGTEEVSGQVKERKEFLNYHPTPMKCPQVSAEINAYLSEE